MGPSGGSKRACVTLRVLEGLLGTQFQFGLILGATRAQGRSRARFIGPKGLAMVVLGPNRVLTVK